jgi:tetratricopeptide (TPR) repeat protein
MAVGRRAARALGPRFTPRAVAGALAALLTLAYAARSVDRVQDWKDQFTLFRHDASVVPRSAKTLNNAGAISSKYGRYEEALDYLQRAIDLNPVGYMVPYYTAAMTLTTMGRDREAAEMYEKSLQNGDRDPFTRNNLGFILVDHEIDVDRGVLLIEDAIRSLGNVATVRDSLAWGYYKQGRLEEALTEVERAIRISRDNDQEPTAEMLEHKARIVEAIRVREGVAKARSKPGRK